jgi:hypothetical protein
MCHIIFCHLAVSHAKQTLLIFFLISFCSIQSLAVHSGKKAQNLKGKVARDFSTPDLWAF